MNMTSSSEGKDALTTKITKATQAKIRNSYMYGKLSFDRNISAYMHIHLALLRSRPINFV